MLPTHEPVIHDARPGTRFGRFLRAWLAVVTVTIFFAGLGHVWMHDANIGGDGHFGAAIEQVAPSDKLALADVPPAIARIVWASVADTVRLADQWSGTRPDLATAPRGPPRTA